MGNSRGLRRKLAASREERLARPRFNIREYPDTPPPALGTVRGWLNKAEAEGLIERKGVQRTGKRGRPAVLWGLPDSGAPESAQLVDPDPERGVQVAGAGQGDGARQGCLPGEPAKLARPERAAARGVQGVDEAGGLPG